MMINKRLINLCDESKKYIGLTVLVSWIGIVCNIITVLIIGEFINKIFKGIRIENGFIITKVTILIILLVIRYISNILYGKFSYKASANARVKLREEIYKKLLNLGTGYTNVESTSSVVQVTVEGVEALEVYFGKYLPQFFYAMLAPITLFIVLSFISLKSAVVFILCVPLIPVSIIAIMKIAKKILKNYWKSYSNLGDTFLDNLQGLTTLKVFNMDEDRHIKMNNEAESFRKITMKVLSMQLNSINIMDLIAFGGTALGTIVTLVEFRSGELMIGSLLVIILLSSEFFIPLRLLGSFFHIAMNGIAASDRIFALLDSDEMEKNIEKPNLKNANIEVRNIDFSYDGERQVLENVSISAKQGELVAIVGESGSGKSTVASLLLNNHKVSRGEITINNCNINNISFDDIYSTISLISTNSYIFNGTVRDNLLMGNLKATKEEINSALKLSRLDLELDILVGEGGSKLSGGQKQRLALARAILADRDVYIFDEATSNIDVESEEFIWEAIYKLSEEKTVIVISHRLANVKNANSIYVMKKGKVVENGKHSQLIDNKKEYFRMINNQIDLEKVREA